MKNTSNKVILSLIFVLIIVIVLINGFNKGRLNKFIVDDDTFYNIIGTRNEDNIEIELKLNGNKLIKDNDNFYYSMVGKSSTSKNPIIDYKGKYNLAILNTEINDKLIENNESIKLLFYNDNSYKIYNLKVTTLPILSINYDGELKEEERNELNMSMQLFDNRENATQKNTSSIGKIHIRGCSTSRLAKVGYKLSLDNKSLGQHKRNNNISLLGMRQDDDWVLYPAYSDQEKVRNVFSSNLWYESCADDNEFNVKNGYEYKYIELFINGKYHGLYALGYQLNKKQVQLKEGEYLFKKNTWVNSELSQDLLNKESYSGYELRNEVKDEDKAWETIKKYYENLYSYNIEKVRSISDINNSIDIFIFNNFIQGSDQVLEFSLKNLFITFKEKNGKKIALYTPWDMDVTFGNVWYPEGKNFTLEYENKIENNYIMQSNPAYWFEILHDEEGVNQIKNRYKELRNTYWSNDSITKILDKYENDIYNSGAFLRDIERWPETNHNSKDEKLSRFKEYVLNRLKYLDKYYE